MIAQTPPETTVRILSVGRAFPPHYYDQEQLVAALEKLWGERFFNPERLRRLHRNVLVGGRHLALPMERYAGLDGWGAANDAWIEVALEVGAAAIEDALERAGLGVGDVDALIFVSVTGIATPSPLAMKTAWRPLCGPRRGRATWWSVWGRGRFRPGPTICPNGWEDRAVAARRGRCHLPARIAGNRLLSLGKMDRCRIGRGGIER